MGQPIAWFDLAANDPNKSRKFFADLFAWDIHVMEENNYGMVDTGASEGIPGGIGQADDSNPAGIVIYAAVDDAKVTLEKVESLGGKTVVQPYEIPGYGVMAVFQDPEGNRVGLWQR
jgi:predicted enzyme related to lactoylglutathione lyase